MTRSLHEDVAALLDDLAASGRPDIADLAVESARRVHDDLLAVPNDDRDPVARVRNVEVPGPNGPVGLRIYEPATSGPRPLFVYVHGGGWVFDTADGHDHLARAIANAGECTVVSVDYRLAPDHPFPAPLADCYAATEWVAAHPDALGGDPDRLVVGGDSAGGNLAAATCLRARDADGPAIAHQVLVYPVLDRNFATDSYRENAEGYLLTRSAMRWFWDHYLESPLDAANPYAAPLRARDLSGLPPATVVAAEFDPLRDEDVAYAERLRDAGVPVELRRYEEMIHGFLPMLADPELDAAREEVAAIGRTIQSLE
ncbi:MULTISPECIES: alpha/beta hydrolase [Haloarcula]|uniref:alpha/beta hydrolase n=1 Tax=Haloarcula TaxID=2237 RepID=UPI0023ECA8A4|nr:alpha/beta hydrolase [Halomicroarcula sp. XH51]